MSPCALPTTASANIAESPSMSTGAPPIGGPPPAAAISPIPGGGIPSIGGPPIGGGGIGGAAIGSIGGALAVPPSVLIFIKSSKPAILNSLVGIRFGIPVVLVYHLVDLWATEKYRCLNNPR